MMSGSDKSKVAQKMKNSSPVGSARRLLTSAPKQRITLLQAKGFGGGVPLNTETTAVNPRVGIFCQITKRCLFFFEMAWAGRTMMLPAR
jgi:hypothetical protein